MKLRASLLTVLVLALLPSSAMAAASFGPGEERDGLKFPNDSLELADLDRDGFDDAVSVGYYDGPCACGEVRITYGGREGLANRIQRFYAEYLGDLEVADFNRDGLLDMAVQGTATPAGGKYATGVVLYLSRRSGEYVQRVKSVPGTPLVRPEASDASMTAGDFDRDGRVDLAVQTARRIQVLFGSGHGRFSNGPVVRPAGSVNDVLATDLDRNGLEDIVVRSSEGVEVFEGRKRGRLGEGELTAVALPGRGGEMVAGDLERDGDRDLLVPNGGRVTTFVNDGAGNLSLGVALETGGPEFARASDVELADVDGNGSRDVLLAYGRGLQLWTGDGGGGFELDSEIPGTELATGVETTDFDTDGRLDLAVQREDVPQADGPTQLTSLLQTAER